jgi:rubrerythrin
MEREKLFKIFKQAIEDEERAYDFYLKASESASEPEIKKTFKDLARDELYHSERLKEEYKKLRDLTT